MAIQLCGFQWPNVSKPWNQDFCDSVSPWQAYESFTLLSFNSSVSHNLCFVFVASIWTLWMSTPDDPLRAPASVPSHCPGFSRRLIGISRLSDSFRIKSHSANLTIWDWMEMCETDGDEGEAGFECAGRMAGWRMWNNLLPHSQCGTITQH